MNASPRCTLHPEANATGACTRCGRFMCAECTYPLPGPLRGACLACVEGRVFPEAQQALKQTRLHVSILLGVALLVVLPAGLYGFATHFAPGDEDGMVIGFGIMGLVVLGPVLLGWRKSDSVATGYFVAGVLFALSFGCLFVPQLRLVTAGGVAFTGYCFVRLLLLRRHRVAFTEERRLRELRVGQAVLASAMVKPDPHAPRIIG